MTVRIKAAFAYISLAILLKNVGVAQYRVVSTLPAEYAGQLPAPEDIAKLLEIIE